MRSLTSKLSIVALLFLFFVVAFNSMADASNSVQSLIVGLGYGNDGSTLDKNGNIFNDGFLKSDSGYIGSFVYYMQAKGTIPTNRLVKLDPSSGAIVGTVDSTYIVGVNTKKTSVVNNGYFYLGTGFVNVVTASPIVAGMSLKCAESGKATALVDATLAGTAITSLTGTAFTNQPSNDGVEVVSSEAADNAVVTIIGTTNGGTVVVTQNVTLTGTTEAATVKTDWDLILAVKLSKACAGTVTVREASADATITTIAPTALTSGVEAITAGVGWTYNVAPVIVAGGASTKVIGVKYTPTTGTTAAYVAKALNGTTAVPLTAALNVLEIYVGDAAGSTMVSIKVGTAEDYSRRIGKAITGTDTAGSTIKAWINP